MFGETLLAIWSAAGLTWWGLAWSLVNADQKRPISTREPSVRRSLSIFKPLPPLGELGVDSLETALESFVAQLDAESEVLCGIHEADRQTVAPLLARLGYKYPTARIKTMYRTSVDEVANPKIAWQHLLARQAEGELWMWSDADVIAPAGFLRAARQEFEASGAALLTFPYVVRALPHPAALLDALFVNAEFYPGVLLLRKWGKADFGLGAGMLFERDAFLKHVDWWEIGAALSDDFYLGQKLQPVRIAKSTLTTIAGAKTWQDARLHDLRWSRTIRWNRPVGSAARVVALPVLGWLGWVLLHPLSLSAWVGLAAMTQLDIFCAAMIVQRAGCKLMVQNLLGLEVWSIWRVILWFLSWWPGSTVVWSGKVWEGPRWELKLDASELAGQETTLTRNGVKPIFLQTNGLRVRADYHLRGMGKEEEAR